MRMQRTLMPRRSFTIIIDKDYLARGRPLLTHSAVLVAMKQPIIIETNNNYTINKVKMNTEAVVEADGGALEAAVDGKEIICCYENKNKTNTGSKIY